jgi:glutamine synthetase
VTAGGRKRCWPVPGAVRGLALVSKHDEDGARHAADPRNAMMDRIDDAAAAGLAPMGAFELEFYLVARNRDAAGRALLAPHPLTGMSSAHRNTMSVAELDLMSPFFDAVYEGAKHLGLTLAA